MVEGMLPGCLCIYCGHERRGGAPEAACAGCGRSAEGVRWWLHRASAVSAVDRAMTLLLLAAVCAFSALAVALVAGLRSPDAIVVLGVAALATFAAGARRVLRHVDGVWRFEAPGAGAPPAWSGEAYVRSGVLIEASALRGAGDPVDVPSYAAAITSTGARAAPSASLGPAIQLAFERRDAGDRALLPVLAATLVGMAARGACSLQRRPGWSRSRASSSPARAHARLVVTLGAAAAESLWLERAVLDAASRASRSTPEGAAAGAPPEHYRMSAAVAAPRGCTLDALMAQLCRPGEADDAVLARVEAGPGKAAASAEAFRAFAAAQPGVVQLLLEDLAEP